MLNKHKSVVLRRQIHRSRLKFNIRELAFYLFCIIEHNQGRETFKHMHRRLFKDERLNITYSTFMSNIKTVSPLMGFIFNEFNKSNHVKAGILNIVDTTLIEEKQAKHINGVDWQRERVTTRGKDASKYHVCGSKGLVFINRSNLVYFAKLLPINTSDQNILKDTCHYDHALKGIVLADRGFNNKLLRERLQEHKNDIWNIRGPDCRLISPYVKKSKTQLTPKEKKLYKRRWRIETVFQKVKDCYSQSSLQMHGRYNKELKKAKFYTTWLIYNFNTLQSA